MWTGCDTAERDFVRGWRRARRKAYPCRNAGADPLAFTGQERLFRCFPGLFSFARSRMPMPLSMLLLVDEQIRMRNESARTIRLRSPFDAC
ncbi:hypothetical protein TAL182_CH02955 [Rhizobium sp. TAL182]|nr:hypothetical protein TAL182_CH02955 [Rhizobium sp. TAL182]